MLRNYFLIAIRNIISQKFYSALNILGLAIGIAGFIIIGLWLKDELSYDRHFENADRIYRIESSLVTGGIPSAMSATDPRIAERVRKFYPQVENIVRVVKMPSLLTAKDKKAFETHTYYADSTFYDIFSYEFVHGDRSTALMQPGSVVIAESIAANLFGEGNPLGQSILINNPRTKEESAAYTVTAVVKDNTAPSHFHPNVVIAKFRRMETFEPTYILFKEGDGPGLFINKIWKEQYAAFFKQDYKKDGQDVILNRLQPLTKIHLSGNKWEELEPNGNMNLVYIFAGIGFIILLIACINYVNLATARSFSRSREVGVRKVLGANKKQLVAQFIIESVILCMIALLLALSIVEIILPFFNTISDKQLILNVADPVTTSVILLFTIIIGCISGIYPAFFISSFQPIKSLKGTLDISKNKPTLRKTLVVLQFSISIIMLIATMVIAKQLEFVKKQDLGFEKDKVLLVNLNDQMANAHKEALKDSLLTNPEIMQVSASYNIPGSGMNHTYITFEMPDSMQPVLINSMYVDYDYVDVMGLKLVQGKGFDSGMLATLDTSAYVILNESAVKLLGWTNAVGKKIETGKTYGLRKGYCVGVVKDFHATSLHDTITPMVLALGTLGRPEGKANFLSVKTKTSNMDETIKFVKGVYESFGQGYPFVYTFLNDEFNKQYIKEEKQKTLFDWFAGLSIFISCLGLIGLASFFTKQRTKEICIRKISGASVFDIVLLLSADFIKLVFISLVIAFPLGYYVMYLWLQNFAFHINISISFFLIAGSLTLLLVMATIGIQSIIAANKNPATVFKYE